MIFISPHLHCESFLTSSTLQSFIERAKTLGRTHVAFTDHGYLHSSFKAYNAALKAKLKPILGLEFYFKDSSCPIVVGTPADRCRYFSATIYPQDQEAYQALCKLVSRTDFKTIEIREETQNLFTWQDLEFLAKYNNNLVLGGIHDIVGKSYLASNTDVGLQLFEKLNNLFKDRLRVAMICEPWNKKYANIVEIKYTDGSRDSLLGTDLVTTNKARNINVTDLVDKSGHYKILSKSVGGIFSAVNKEIEFNRLHTGYLPLPCDATLRINKFLMTLAGRYKVPVIASDYAYYANKEDKPVQHVVLEGKDKVSANQHMKTEEEIVNYLQLTMGLGLNEAVQIVMNNQEWAKLFDNFKLAYEWRLADPGGDPLKMAMDTIAKKGRMKWDNPVYVDRLKTELKVIAKNGVKDLTPYFLPIVEVLDRYIQEKQLPSPGRGSAGGSLFCYCLGITNLDPIRYDLPFSRFFSETRIKMKKLPDIDTDLPQRETLTGKDGHSGFLYERWGNRAGHVSTRQTVRLRSAIKDVERYLNGKVSKETERFTAGLPQPPQGISDQHFVFGYENEDDEHVPGIIETNEDLQKYVDKNPDSWEIVTKAMGITRAYSKHACAYVLSDIPLDQIIPLKEGHITHYEHKEVEAAGLVKYDFLTISQLLDIQVCIEFINKKNGDTLEPGYFMHNGVKTYIWDLPHDPETFKSIWGGSTETLFQINSKGMSALVKEMLPNSLEDLTAVLALERPGPKDYIDPLTGRNMVEEYLLRRKGESEPDIQELVEILPNTYGVMCFQEDLGKISKQLAGFNDEDAELLRENMAKKKMVELTKIKPAFIEGAKKNVSIDVAEKIWEQMVTFGRYGFSIIHSYEYAMITYACMFLRHNYRLDWWAAILSNAKESEITGKFWRYAKELVAPPDINLSTDTMVPDYERNLIRSKLGVIRGMGDASIEPIVANRPYRDIQDFVNKDVAGPSLAHKLIHVGVMDSLFKPNMSLMEKLKAYQDAVEIKDFQDKKANADKEGKKFRALQPKEGTIPEQYVNLHPLKDAAMKKAVLPTMMIDLHSLGAKYSKVLDPEAHAPKVLDRVWKRSVFLLDGNRIETIDKAKGIEIEKDLYVAATGYIVEAKEFDYHKGTKRALKLIISFDNYMCEKVLWPDYETAELIYPKELKKGCIATVFMRKRVDSNDEMNVTQLVVEG